MPSVHWLRAHAVRTRARAHGFRRSWRLNWLTVAAERLPREPWAPSPAAWHRDAVNAHIEQKNWTHVRKLVGYLRYDTPAAVAALNSLYRHGLRLFQNLFRPSVKLVRKERVGARLRRRYDAPRTPLDRVQACPEVDPAAVASWLALRDQLDPFALSQAIDRKIERLLPLAPPPWARLAPPTASASEGPPTRVVRPRRPPPPRHLKTPFTFGNRLRRPVGPSSRVTS